MTLQITNVPVGDARLAEFAEVLDRACMEKHAVTQFPADAFSLDDAYRVQWRLIQRRCERGEQVKGIKLGFTSRAKMAQMGVNALIWGWLTDAMIEEDGAQVELGRYIHPRVEPEICFLTRRAINAPLTLLEAAEYVEAVAPALEIIDSRYADFKFNLESVVADNCSSAGVVIGPYSRRVDGIANAAVRLEFDGKVVQVGSTAAILGNPLRSIVQASKLLHASGLSLPAGSLVMAGAATAAETLRGGTHVACHFGRNDTSLGQVEFSTKGVDA